MAFSNLGIALGSAVNTYQQGQQQDSLANYRTQELQLQKQAMENAQKRQQFQQISEAEKAIWDTLTPYVQHGLTVGQSPEELTKHAQPMLDSLQKLHKAGGLPDSVMARWTGLVSQPNPADVERKMAEAKDPLKVPKEQAEIDLKKAQAGYYSGKSTGASISDAEVDAVGQGRQAPPSATGRDPRQFHDFMARVYEKYPDYDPSRFKSMQAAKGADVRADSNALSKLVQQREVISSFEKTAIKNGDILVKLGEKVDKTGVPIFERFTRPARQIAGDTEVAEFNTQLQAYRSEVAKILANPNLSGQLTDSARKEVEKFISGDSSAKQIKAVHELLKGDFGRRMESLDESIADIKGRLKGATGVNPTSVKSGGTEQNVTADGGGWEPTSIPGVRIREKQ